MQPGCTHGLFPALCSGLILALSSVFAPLVLRVPFGAADQTQASHIRSMSSAFAALCSLYNFLNHFLV